MLCTREFQSSIRESVHYLLQERIRALGLNDAYRVNVQDIQHRYHEGTRFIFMGLHHNADAVKSTEAIRFCWVEEAHGVTESSWDYLIPTIREPESEIWVSFNPRFKYDATSQRFKEHPPPAELHGKPYAFVREVGWRDNPWFPDVLKDEMLTMKASDYERYEHVWEGAYQVVTVGAIFGKQMIAMKRDEPRRLCRFKIERNVPVDSSWDLGKDDATAIWFWQIVGKEKRAIAYYEARGEEIDHYCTVLRDFRKWANIEYGTHYMPHDVEANMLGMKQTRKAQFKDGGVWPIKVVPRVPAKGTGIAAARKWLGNTWMHEDYCGNAPPKVLLDNNPQLPSGIDVLGSYRFEYDEDKATFKQTPMHDWASNGADALMQIAQASLKQKHSGPSRQPQINVV